MRYWVFVAAFGIVGCHGDSPEDRQRYQFMAQQYQGWADTATRGEHLAPGVAEMARLHCVQARRDQQSIKAARPLARACDAYLDKIQAAAR